LRTGRGSDANVQNFCAKTLKISTAPLSFQNVKNAFGIFTNIWQQ